jgi:Ca-activated chloride channel family protein
MSFGMPATLPWLWGLLPLALWLAWRWRARRRDWGRIGALVPARSSAGALEGHRIRLAVTWVALALGLIALAQPRWGFVWEERQKEGLEVVIVLDVSTSMGAQDLKPSRMARARHEVQDLLDLAGGDRVGLVVFAGGAYPRVPLTLDVAMLAQVVRDDGTTRLVSQGSDLGRAVDLAVELLGDPGETDRAVVLISDGEDHAGEALLAVGRAKAAGVHTYTVGVGTLEGAPVPNPVGDGFLKDGQGKVVISRLGEDLLTAMARAGEGAYVRSAAGNGDMRAIYLDEMRTRLAATDLGAHRERTWDERFSWPLGLAIFLLLAIRGRRAGRLKLSGTAPALLGLALLSTGSARAEEATAVERLAEAQAAAPDDLGLAEDLGQALFEAGRMGEAARVLAEASDRAIDPEQRRRARYNSGLAEYEAGRLTQALEGWKRVLEDEPEHGGATQNAAAVQQELAQRLQEPPPEGEQGEEEGEPGEPGDTGAPPEAGDTGAPPEDVDGEVGDRGELDDAAEDQAPPEEAARQAGGVEGELTEEEARRLLDGVEEGTPRVGRSRTPPGGKNW